MKILRAIHVNIGWNYCSVGVYVYNSRTNVDNGYLVAIVYRRPVSVVDSFVEKVG
jgi:hypothetical protein